MILFVCTGNTCRSPMAEGLYNALYPGFKAKSAGITASDGAPAAVNAAAAAAKYGADISNHRSRRLEEDMLKEAEVVYGLTQTHADYIRARFPEYESKIKTLGEIADPYGDTPEVYAKTAEEIYECLKSLYD